MKRILTLIALAAAVIATASCDKEGGNETPTVEFARSFYQLSVTGFYHIVNKNPGFQLKKIKEAMEAAPAGGGTGLGSQL